MLSLKAYFDESGHFSDPNIHFTGMAGFVAPASVWAEVEEKWEAVRSEYALQDPFHMRLFAHNQGQFRDWEKSRKDSLYRSLIQILVEAELVPTGCVVSNSAFQSLNPRQQAAMRSPYFTAMQECVRGACAQVIALEPEVVDMAFARQVECGTLDAHGENSPDNSGTTERLFYGIKQNLPQLGSYMGKYGSGDPAEMIPLQAADMLAYEMTKDYEGVLSQRPIRKSYQELMRMGGRRPLMKYLDRLDLLSILKESEFPDTDGFAEIDENSVLQIFARHSAQILINERRESGTFNYSYPKWLLAELRRRWN